MTAQRWCVSLVKACPMCAESTAGPQHCLACGAEAHSFVHTPFFKDLGHSGLLNGFFI